MKFQRTSDKQNFIIVAREKKYTLYMVEKRLKDYKFSSETMQERRQWKENLCKVHKNNW